jgi:type III restriction enzyme
MKLKGYQEKVIVALKDYLNALNEFKIKYEKLLAIDTDIKNNYDFPKMAFKQATNKGIYHSKTNSLDNPLPDIYLKVPTGGGKTLLACHGIDLIHQSYLKKQTGLVLWIVPSTQIYRQTILALKNRDHPYRQILDKSSGGRTLIKEKTELFNRLDIDENLVILMLMLPSANRQNKETLKIFRDAGGFTDFFPAEDNYPAQEALLKLMPNLDYFGEQGEIFQRQIKTSLGNALKVLKPLIIIDEGHRAYGEQARNTVRNFNPSFILELSATPPPHSNELVKITGRELHEEDMIKLDIHLNNKSSLDWKDTLLASFEKRNELEQLAKEYEQNTGVYIRPICLIQVERTGKDQLQNTEIHAEHAKDYLIKKCGIPETHIAIKSSEKDDIEGMDLFAKDCEIRYIITKQALQEGWDCSFAYILTILTNPQSATGITQLVGRILRQPFAVKTNIKALDECYIYTFKPNASVLVREIKNGLESEGMGDIVGRIVNDENNHTEPLRERITTYRQNFNKFEGKIYLPKFVIQEKNSFRDLIFEVDILSAIDWKNANISTIADKILSNQEDKEQELILGLSNDEKECLQETGRSESKGTLGIDEGFLARQLSDIVVNPWIAFELGHNALQRLLEKYDSVIIASNFVFIIEELKKILQEEKNRLAKEIFEKMIDDKKLCFFLIQEEGTHLLPRRIKVKSNKQLVRSDNSPIEHSLFDYVGEEDFNDTEKSIAIYLDEQEQLLWWYRNRARKDFHIQGWQRHKIYPDFIAAKKSLLNQDEYDTVYVLETKGNHLKGNDDTKYKENVFKLCNELSITHN